MELWGSRWSGCLFLEVLEEAGGCILHGRWVVHSTAYARPSLLPCGRARGGEHFQERRKEEIILTCDLEDMGAVSRRDTFSP